MAAPAEDQTRDTEKGSVFESLTGTQKSAILMMLIGEDEASEILRNLSPREVQHLGTAMYSVQGLDQETVNLVLDEFLVIIKAQTSLGMGGSNYIRNIMVKALGEDKSQSVLSRIAPSTSERPIEILDWMDARSIAELISDEHPQIVALVVSYLDAGQGADVLGLLPENVQAEVIRRIATLKTVGPDAIRELEEVMQRKFKANTSLRATQVGGIDAAARIMNFTQQAMEGRIMKDIAKGDKGLMLAIQESMFVFDTLVMSDDKSLQTLLRSVDTELLIMALKGADEPLQEKLFSCMSKRAAANIMDEMEALGPVRLTEVQSAQKEIINVARRLSDEGSIVLAGRGGDDFV
jgi:flagellar motor switch protein FliG